MNVFGNLSCTHFTHKPAMEATASLSSHAASAASAASTSRPRARPSRSRGIFVSAAGRRSCPLQLPRRCRPPQPSPPQPLSAPSDPAAAAAVGRRPPQPPVRGRPTQPLQQPSAAVRSSRRPSQPSFFPLDLFAWLSRFPHGFHGFTPQTKQSTASIVGSHWSGSNPRGGPGRRDHLGPVRPGTRVC